MKKGNVGRPNGRPILEEPLLLTKTKARTVVVTCNINHPDDIGSTTHHPPPHNLNRVPVTNQTKPNQTKPNQTKPVIYFE
jgi:hypothetical protein